MGVTSVGGAGKDNELAAVVEAGLDVDGYMASIEHDAAFGVSRTIRASTVLLTSGSSGPWRGRKIETVGASCLLSLFGARAFDGPHRDAHRLDANMCVPGPAVAFEDSLIESPGRQTGGAGDAIVNEEELTGRVG